ncbi:MAG: L-threonylcarbamoyladenylate synthase [Firmicutes bacterium]|nr:L-threonylcarbamoyladenylate synthase [Bacillota bacterium]MDD4336200.1 L-threonylcarbamoyladenylate synthase [Bacillota bacterium]MDD4792775.1 L-threonylcarbamoyladenylate synthase [Bacillota bacterium]
MLDAPDEQGKLATVRIQVDPRGPADTLEEELGEAARVLRQGGTVAFPTETVYGLGGNALDRRAVARIFVAKGRPQDNPLIVHIAEMEALETIASSVSPEARRLADRFWPGPLTLILPKSDIIPNEVTAGLESVAVRMPSHPVACALIRAAGVPVAAPSANMSGRPSPTAADHVWRDMAGRIDVLVDGGLTDIGVESTVLDMTCRPPVILRPGGVALEAIRELIPETRILTGADDVDATPRSPGLRHKHYSPSSELWLVVGEWESQVREIEKRAQAEARRGRRVGLLVSAETAAELRALLALESDVPENKSLKRNIVAAEVGSRGNLSEVASALFDGMRRLDEANVGIIFAESYDTAGVGLAIMNRLTMAAGGRVVRV